MLTYVYILTLLLTSIVGADPSSKRMVAIEFDGTKSSDTYVLNVIKISEDPYSSNDDKHHYAVDPDVKVLAKHTEDKKLKESFIAHFYFDQILSAEKFRYKDLKGDSFLFNLECDKPCSNEEICTVFGCQLDSLK